jgi:hypothetical protein
MVFLNVLTMIIFSICSSSTNSHLSCLLCVKLFSTRGATRASCLQKPKFFATIYDQLASIVFEPERWSSTRTRSKKIFIGRETALQTSRNYENMNFGLAAILSHQICSHICKIAVPC